VAVPPGPSMKGVEPSRGRGHDPPFGSTFPRLQAMMGSCYKTPILKNVLEIASWYRKNHPEPLAPSELFEKFLDRMDDEDLEFAVEMSTGDRRWV